MAGIALLGPQIAAGQAAPPRDLTLRPVAVIGREGGAVTFDRIAHVAVAPGGEIVVADAGNARVVILDPDGRLVATVGRSGSGPGEFQAPLAIAVARTGLAFDPPRRRVVEFDLAGRVIETRVLPAAGGLNITRMLPTVAGGFVVATTPGFSTGRETQPNVLVLRASADFARLDTLLSYHSGAGIFHSARGAGWGIDASDMGPAGAWAMLGDSIVVLGDGLTGEIRWLHLARTSQPLRTARVATPGRRTSDADRRAFLGRLRAAGRQLPADAVASLPPAWSAITQLVAARNGDVWVRGAMEPGVWTVIRPDGTLSRYRLPADFRLFEVLPRRLVGVTTSSLGEELLTVLEYSPR